MVLRGTSTHDFNFINKSQQLKLNPVLEGGSLPTMLRAILPAIQHVFRSFDISKSPSAKKSTAVVAPSNQAPEKKPEKK